MRHLRVFVSALLTGLVAGAGGGLGIALILTAWPLTALGILGRLAFVSIVVVTILILAFTVLVMSWITSRTPDF